MHAKYTGHIGVAFGSAGPGGTHLLNGLYDAREDHVPVIAIVGQFATNGMNMDTFQEMNENPIYADVAIYNRTITTAEQIPMSLMKPSVRLTLKVVWLLFNYPSISEPLIFQPNPFIRRRMRTASFQILPSILQMSKRLLSY